jgi:hypothetical protein
MLIDVLTALARHFPIAERLAARILRPVGAAYPVPVAALALAPHQGAGLVIRGRSGVYAAVDRVVPVGRTVVLLATVADQYGDRFDQPHHARPVQDCLPGVVRALRTCDQWTLVYPATAAPVMVDPFPTFVLKPA